MRWPDGSEHWLASFGQVQRDEDGRPVLVAGINVDVTARRQAEALANDKLALEQANRAKNDFLSRMSHEFRTPLNAVLGFTQLMRHDPAGSLQPRQRHPLQRIESVGRAMLAMVEDMLQSSHQAHAGGADRSADATSWHGRHGSAREAAVRGGQPGQCCAAE